MKSSIAFVALFLFARAQSASPGDVAVGSIVTVAGNISGIDADNGRITVGSNNTYFVTANSALTVNGKRGSIADLANGMKVTGSAEVAKADVRFEQQKKIIRMLTATTDPSKVRPVAASTPFRIPAQNPSGMPAPAMPFTPADMENLKKKLSGTFWTVPNQRLGNSVPDTQWVGLNPDGTITSSSSDKAGFWMPILGSKVQVRYYNGLTLELGLIGFNTELNRGLDVRFGPVIQSSERFAWTLIAAPTQEMLTKVSQHPPPPTSASVSVAAPASVATSVPAPVQPSPETQQAASGVIKTNHNNLVFVTGKDGAGSGFIANMDGANYLVTNAHVAAGVSDANFKTLDGTIVERGAAGVAVGHDIFRMALSKGGKPFDVMEGVDENAGIGDEVVVLGNAEGSGVINTITGKIVGIGPNLVETDAQFVPGNSGSPIVHLKTGKVIGVATYAVTRKYDALTNEKMKEPVVRRFGYRIDSVKTWQPVNWQAFYGQAATMERIHALTEALDNFFRDIFQNKSRVTASKHTNPVIKNRIGQWLESKNHKLSVTDRANADANFISFLKVACQTDLAEAQRSLSYDYFQRRLTEEQRTRNEMAQAFTDIIKNIRE